MILIILTIMTETRVGIILFLNKFSPMEGTIKHRMTDFIVEEIDEEKNIVKHNPDFKQGFFIRIIDHFR